MHIILVLVVCVFFTSTSAQNLSARNFYSDCGQVVTKREFIIESLNYPSNYPLNYQCFYLIKGLSCPTRFTLQFIDFTVENSLGCSKDRLEIADKDALCGNRSNEVKHYFSEQGALIIKFVSDSDNTARGYRILITRSQCQSDENNPETTIYTVPKWHTTNRDVEYATTIKPTFDQSSKKCCQNFHNSKNFILTSPNFPYSMSTPSECIYEIHKIHSDICRLRIHVMFFWLGRYDNNCFEGFLEIDGKPICGCQSELKIIVPFKELSTKLLRFVSKGYERTSYSGFVMDIIQDECPKKFVPKINENDTRQAKNIKLYNDQINRVSFPNQSHEVVVERLHLIKENTEVFNDNIASNNSQAQVYRNVFFYNFPDYNRKSKDREETEYIDTSSSNFFTNNNINYEYCRNWNQIQFNSLSTRNLPVCKTNEGSVVERKCVDFKQLRGYFKSPGYPFYYPGNANICYRFYKLPGYCSIRVYMKDFSLQDSHTCENDYLLFANQLRYCGSRLANTVSTLDMRYKTYEQMNFVSDAFYCRRGFFGAYEQIPCQETPHPVNPITPTPPYFTPCSKTTQEEMFVFEVYDNNEPSCSLVIKKYSEDVCSVKLYFEDFNLFCASESLVIDGMMYCGKLKGQSVNINVLSRDLIITYRRSLNDGLSGRRFRIRGVQISDECPYPDVPAERYVNPRKLNLTHFENTTQVFLKMEKKFKNICGVITNTTQAELPETFCDIIMKENANIKDCIPLLENSLFVPFNESQKIELKIRNAEKTEEIEFQEIDCDKLTDS